MVILKLHRPHWIKDEGEDPADQCAHGSVELCVNGVEFACKSDGEWTVSAAALFLLRTVSSDHTPEDSVAGENFLIPCCGFNIWPIQGAKYPYSVMGCDSGIDPELRHRDGMVHLVLGERSATVGLQQWAQAVLQFSDQVQNFYDSSAPRDELKDDFDRAGWDFFWLDWKVQRDLVRKLAGVSNREHR